MATVDANTPKVRPQSAEARKIAFAAQFPRLRLVSSNLQQLAGSSVVSFTVDGSGDDLIHAGILTQSMIAALPRCGVKHFGTHYPESAGIYCRVQRIAARYRIRAHFGEEEVFGVVATLREIWGVIDRVEGAAAFAAVFPGLHLIRKLFGSHFAIILAGQRDDLIRAGFVNQAMLDKVRGFHRTAYFQDSDTEVQRHQANHGYLVETSFRKDERGLGTIVRDIFLKFEAEEPAKKRDPRRMTLARVQEYGFSLDYMCDGLAKIFPPDVASEIREHARAIKAHLERTEARLERPERPSHLRLVVDNGHTAPGVRT